MDIALDNSLLPALPESVIITEIQPYKVSILEYYFTNVPTTG